MLSKFDMTVGTFAVLFMLSCVFTLDYITVDADETPEYKNGYIDGYNEHNNTKYQAACEISSTYYGYTDAQHYYAKGYRAGYISFQNDNYSRAQAEKRNETARILGV